MLGILFTAIYVVAVAALFIRKRSQLVRRVPERVTVPVRAHNSGLVARRVRAGSSNGSNRSNASSDGAKTVDLAASSHAPAAAEAMDDGSTTNGPVEAGKSGNGTDKPAQPAAADSALWNPRALRPKPNTLFAHYEPGSLPYLLGCLLAKPSVLLIGFTIFAAIFVVFYSVFFTDVPRGILSGMFGSLGYWMSQQGVRRGDQPWFYYFLLIPLYQPIAVFFSVAAGIFFSWRGIRWLKERLEMRRYDEATPLGAFNTDREVPFARFDAFLPLFLGWWLVGAVGIYSWAGEKMPWLMMHMTRPAIFFASLFIGALAMSLIRRRRERMEDAGLFEDYAVEQPHAPLMGRPQRGMAGARFSLGDMLGSVGLGKQRREPAYAYAQGADAGTARYSRGGIPNPPPRRQAAYAPRGAARTVAMVRYQDPPWVTWNRADSTFPFWTYLTLFVLFAVAWGLSMSQLAYSSNYASWAGTWVYAVLMLALTVGFAVWLGVGRALRYLAVGILAVLGIYEFHSAFMLSYRNPDVATELAVYVQTSPDVTRSIKELEAFSFYTTGSKDVKVVYDSEVSWPMEWYLGDYPNKKFIGGGAPSTSDYDAPVMFLGYNRLTDEQLNASYVPQRYALRWWFPEEWYKNDFLPNQFQKDANGAIINDAEGKAKMASPLAQAGDFLHSTFNAIGKPEDTAQLWKYLMYREPPKPLGSTDFVLFIRKDVVQQWHNLQNAPLPSTDVPIQVERTNGPIPNREVIP
jgi:hypothetical protein